MAENSNNTVTFPEDHPVAFCLFFLWIYQFRVPPTSPEEGFGLISFMKAWLLADKLCMPHWQNRINDRIMGRFLKSRICVNSFLWLLENGRPSCMLFKLCWDHFVWELAHHFDCSSKDEPESEFQDLLSCWPDCCEKTPAQLIGQVVIEAKRKEPYQKPSTMGCKYHVHPDGKQCQKGNKS
jgi:hypothetical protein